MDAVLKAYEHDLATYAKVGELLNAEMEKGLSKDGNKKASVKMLITYVRNLPTGKGTCNSIRFSRFYFMYILKISSDTVVMCFYCDFCIMRNKYSYERRVVQQTNTMQR